MRHGRGLWIGAAALCVATASLAVEGGAPSGEGPVSPNGELTIGVAPFETSGPAGVEVPDVATLLAQRLGTKGVGRVVGPDSLQATASAEPSASDVKQWTSSSGVGLLVVGRTTRLGRKLSIDAHLRAAGSGGILDGPYVEEVVRPEDLGAAVERLADRVLAGATHGRETKPVAAGPAATASASGAKPEEKRGRAFRDDAPIAIQADELEAVESQGSRKLAFTGHVRASQDDMRLRSNRLDAFYLPGDSQPERLVATGQVEIDRGGRQAFCDTATYFREGQKIVCVGNDAVLQQESDRVRGKTIIFYLDRDVLEVEGGADVLIHPKSNEKKGGGTT